MWSAVIVGSSGVTESSIPDLNGVLLPTTKADVIHVESGALLALSSMIRNQTL